MYQLSWVGDNWQLFVISTPNARAARNLASIIPAKYGPRLWRIVNKRATLMY